MSIEQKVRTAYQRLQKFSEEYPEWVEQARQAIRPWERQEELLLKAVGEALQDAYERGRKGDYPACNQLQEVVRPRVVRRAPAIHRVAEKAPVVRRIRRQ